MGFTQTLCAGLCRKRIIYLGAPVFTMLGMGMRWFVLILFVLLTACGGREPAALSSVPLYPNETPQLRILIEAAAAENAVPVALVQKVILRESGHRPTARNGPYYGLMQILPQTARTMGFQGPPNDLLDAETNLRYATRYLRGAWLVSGHDMDSAVMWYARGYYYEAKRLGLLAQAFPKRVSN